MQPWPNNVDHVPALFRVPPPPNGIIPPPVPFSFNSFPPSNAAQPPANRPAAQDAAVSRHFTREEFPGAHHPTLRGNGQLTWLSSRAGVITCKDGKSISFQNKEFTDQTVNDLSTVLRVGFQLKFKASAGSNAAANQYTATNVQPINGEDARDIFPTEEEIDLEAHNPTTSISKDQYSKALELRAIDTILGAFNRLGEHKLALGAIHNHMSEYTEDPIYRYVGTSSMKRRQFVQQRTHVLILHNDDSVELQHPSVYEAVVMLASFLLRHGGVTSIEAMYEYYSGQNFNPSVRDAIGYHREHFLGLLTRHPFAFALFPDKTYVSARRNFPDFDYQGFIIENFPYMLEPPPQPQPVYYQEQPHFQYRYGMEQQRLRPTSLIRNPLYQGPPQPPPPPPQNPQYDYEFLNERSAAPLSAPVQYRYGGLSALYDQSSEYSAPQSLLGDDYRGPRAIGGPVSTQASLDNSGDLFVDFAAEYGTKLTHKDIPKKVQQPIGRPGCTCECTCGASNRSVGAIGTKKSVALPTIYPGVNGLAPIGTRPFSNSTASSSEEPAPFTEPSYSLFGNNNNILQGSSFAFNNNGNNKK